MSLDLPAPLPAYFAAKNAREIEAMLACFAEDAIVRDESKDLRGHHAVRAWMTETTRKYGVKIDPKDIEKSDETTTVAALVSGDFPGSPVTLRYRFKIAGSKITRLEIAV